MGHEFKTNPVDIVSVFLNEGSEIELSDFSSSLRDMVSNENSENLKPQCLLGVIYSKHNGSIKKSRYALEPIIKLRYDKESIKLRLSVTADE